jgi:peptidyl-prolyl cis-trans isomerase A (cyclophilin A)
MASLMIGRRSLLALAGALAAHPTFAQPTDIKPKVIIQTGQGPIVLELEQGRAPLTVANFLRYVDTGRYDGSTIYRASRSEGAPTIGLIEGGLQYDPAKLLPPIAHESTLATGLSHQDGTISMARDAPGTATADFFICSGPASYLDANPNASGDNLGYAAFGRVVEGMDVARAILALPTTGAARNPEMQGQMLDPPVPILSMKRGG